MEDTTVFHNHPVLKKTLLVIGLVSVGFGSIAILIALIPFFRSLGELNAYQWFAIAVLLWIIGGIGYVIYGFHVIVRAAEKYLHDHRDA